MRKLYILILFVLSFVNMHSYNLDITAEAEDATLTGTTEVKYNDNASNGIFIKSFSSPTTGTLSFDINGVVTQGVYKLEIFHFNDNQEQNIDISINGGTSTTVTLQESNWAYQSTAKSTFLDITLIAGNNTVTISTPYVTVLFDKFRVTDNFNVYYVSSSVGLDTNDGSVNAPWQTINKLNLAFANDSNGGWIAPGDKVLFKSGDTFLGQLITNRSGLDNNHIEISNYGSGELPIISGSFIAGGFPDVDDIENVGDYIHPIKLTNSSNLTITNLWIKNDRQNNNRYSDWQKEKSYGILVIANQYGGIVSNLIFKNLKITDILSPVIPPSSDFNGFKVTGIYFESEANEEDSGGNVTTEIAFDNITIEDNYFSNTGKAGVQAVHKGDFDPADWSVNRNRNFVLKNNHFYRTGGSGIILSKMMNALVENNNFDQTGYDATPENDADFLDDRLANRGSGMWVFRCKNVIAQYNRSYGAHGSNDSYGMHIDFGNEDIIYQYNYSEDNEGFVEVLGENNRCTYRFNVSLNDGDRPTKGNTLWVSDYAGTGNQVTSNNTYIYNNTIYLDKNYTPDISIVGQNTYVYNNIFVNASVSGVIGQSVTVTIDPGSQLYMSNNLYHGNVTLTFRGYGSNWYNLNPDFITAGDTSQNGYDITDSANNNSASGPIDNGFSFPQPSFSAYGVGIFENISEYPTVDTFGEEVNINNNIPNIGASNAHNLYNTLSIDDYKNSQYIFTIYPNPVKEDINLLFARDIQSASVEVFDVQGKSIYTTLINPKVRKASIKLPYSIMNGIYFIRINDGITIETKQLILYR